MKKRTIKEFLRVKEKELSPSTMKMYRWTVENVYDPDPEKVSRAVFSYLEEGKYAQARQCSVIIRNIYNFLGDDPRQIYLPRKKDNEIKSVDMKTVEKIAKDESIPLEYRALVFFMANSGLRISEAMELKVGDLDFKKCEGKVISKGKKKGEKRDDFVFHNKTFPILKKLSEKKDLNDSLFGLKDYNVVWRFFNKNFTFTPHQLRHTFCTYYSKWLSPYKLQRLARHKSFNTTKRYIDTDLEDAKTSFREISKKE